MPLHFFNDVLPYTSDWSRTNSGDYLACAVDRYSDPVDYTFTRDALANEHPLLPEILDAMFTHCRQSWMGHVYGVDLCHTLTLLHYSPINLTDKTGEQYVFCDMDDVKAPDNGLNSGRALTFQGYALKLMDVELGGNVINLVTTSTLVTIDVEQKELDARYPGWRERFEISEHLGTTKEELLRYIFTNASTSELTLNPGDLTFE